MSKSRGNVVTPMPLVEEYGPDALRYWALNGRPGVDTALDEGQMKVGRRLAIKVLNASKFALGVMGDTGAEGAVTNALDRSMLRALDATIADATAAFDGYDYARALELSERFFWGFCDDYVELVKQRAYGASGEEGASSARAALGTALSALLRLFAPHLPFVTEEVWSWWNDGSVHRAAWPAPGSPDRSAVVYGCATSVLGEIRKAKTTAKRSMRAPVERVLVRDTGERLDALAAALDDLQLAGTVTGSIDLVEADAFAVEVDLADDDS
jgi:valyl-tRNA synthetase